MSIPWKQNPEMDAKLAKSNPFRPIKEKQIHGFLVAAAHSQISPPRRALEIVPDAAWPALWRVKLPNGQLTDMVNLTRAKDAAISLGSKSSMDRSLSARSLPLRPHDKELVGWVSAEGA